MTPRRKNPQYLDAHGELPVEEPCRWVPRSLGIDDDAVRSGWRCIAHPDGDGCGLPPHEENEQ